MAGNWLASFGRRVVRHETFERLVSPAIADLQREAAHGMTARVRHYAAIAAVLACALVRDFRLELATAFSADARRHVWTRAALWALGAAGFTGWMMFREELRVLGAVATSATLTTALLGSLLSAFSAAMVAASFCLVRRGSSPRTIGAVTLVLFVTALATAFAIHPMRMSADRELYDIAHSMNVDSTSPNAVLAVWLDFQADDLDPLLARGRDLRGALGVINGALLGVLLARSRRWRVPLTAVVFVATTFVVGMAAIRMEFTVLEQAPTYAFQSWRDVAVTFVVASAGLLMTRGTPGLKPRPTRG